VSPLRRFWYLVEYIVTVPVLLLLQRLPLPLVTSVARLVGRTAFLVWRARRRTAVENALRTGMCADTASANRLARAAFEAFVLMIAETAVVRLRLSPANWHEFVDLEASPTVETLLRQPGQGFIVASAHIGNWEVVARAVSMVKPVCVVHRPFKNPYLERVLHAGRSGENLRLVSRLDRDPMRFLQALARGDVLAIMVDQHATDKRVAVTFFGHSVWATKSVAMLHLVTKAPLLAAFAIRTGPLRYRAIVVGPLCWPRSGDREKDIHAITQALTDEVEKIIRQFPEQYLWGHRRWRG
jgi:Kdo2-lipid IVA lauroyltransferase/acyltransferase